MTRNSATVFIMYDSRHELFDDVMGIGAHNVQPIRLS